ncbi:hypothetical protein [Rudaeicoccus suwonensis]|uniref:DUF1453 family protein n=1 Tax=Rudaeicoccus suwonensis TaxID=657409 RepID=A0A561E6R5_9MICO|nr:hypothetical protein [Rudaeicoccus suwonensis]TWE11318.1 hypothetical protein BKA23_0080 [Rudaeicoccus suwonensis]
MNSNPALIVLEVIAVIAFILWRQVRTTEVASGAIRGPIIIGGIGLLNLSQFMRHHVVASGEIAALVVGLLLAVAIAWPRAHSMKVWRDADGRWFKRGTPMTIVWWAVLMVSHVAVTIAVPAAFGEKVSGFSAFDGATIMVFLGVSLAAQALFTEHHLQRCFPGQRISGISLAK